MSRYDIKERCLNFAVNIIFLANKLPKTPAGFSIADQLIDAGTSVGANVAEAQDAISKKEFIKTMNIALKECRETLYWLILIHKTNLILFKDIEPHVDEGKQIRAILTAIVKNARRNP